MSKMDDLIKEIETWMTETCSRSMYTDTEVRNRLLDVWISLTECRAAVDS